MLEQQGVDVMASAISEVLPEAYKLQTGYGLLGHLATKGADKDFWKHFLTQGATFAAFSVMHGLQEPHEAVKPLQDAVNQAAEQGLSPREAAQTALDHLPRPTPEAQPDRSGPGQVSPGVVEVPVKPPEQFAPRAPGSEVPIGAEPSAPSAQRPAELPSLPPVAEPPRTEQAITGGQTATEQAPEGRTGQNLGVPEPSAPVVQPAVEARTPKTWVDLQDRFERARQARAYLDPEHPNYENLSPSRIAELEAQVERNRVGVDELRPVVEASKLTAPQKKVMLSYLEGLTMDEIGKARGSERQAVEQMLARITKTLGMDQSFADAIYGVARGSRIVDMAESGHVESALQGDSVEVKKEATRNAKGRLAKLEPSEKAANAVIKEMTALQNKIERENERGTMTQEKEKAYDQQLDALTDKLSRVYDPNAGKGGKGQKAGARPAPAEVEPPQVPEVAGYRLQAIEAPPAGGGDQGQGRAPGPSEPVSPAPVGVVPDPRAEPMPSTAMREQGGTMGGGPMVGVEAKDKTALANEKVKQERIDAGLAEIEKQVPQSDKEVWDRTREMARANPDAGYLLAREVIDSKGKRRRGHGHVGCLLRPAAARSS